MNSSALNIAHSDKNTIRAAPVLQLQNVNLSLKGKAGLVNILHGINLDIQPNETIAIVGPSGSGKTSMLMLMAGLEHAISGNILLKGQDITKATEDELAILRAKHIGIVFQSFHLIPTMSAQENVAVPLHFLGDKDAMNKAAAMLDRLGLSHRKHHYPAEMSGGEQQRVAIARACVTNPSIILADEPTGNLDHDTGEHVIELLFEQSKQHGTTLILVTHDMELAKRCSRIVRIRDGRLDV